jgi:hypothetical protein
MVLHGILLRGKLVASIETDADALGLKQKDTSILVHFFAAGQTKSVTKSEIVQRKSM